MAAICCWEELKSLSCGSVIAPEMLNGASAKVGPIARTVEDCAIVFSVIHGFDGLDPTAVDRPFDWPPRRNLRSLKVGYIETTTAAAERNELRALADLGVKLVPLKLPSKYPVGALTVILDAEASAVDRLVTKSLMDSYGYYVAGSIERSFNYTPLRARGVTSCQ